MQVFITGANRGIGLELARHALTLGHTVHAGVRSPEQAKELSMLKTSNPKLCHVHTLDVRDGAQITRVCAALAHESLDLLINNAGVLLQSDADFTDLSEAAVLDSFNINCMGAIRVTQGLIPALERSRNPKIVQITSKMGSIEDNTSGGAYAYRISKAALNMFHKCLSIEYPKVTCLALHPGWVKTEMGGKEAPIEPSDSALGLWRVIDGAGAEMSGGFFDFRGQEIPW